MDLIKQNESKRFYQGIHYNELQHRICLHFQTKQLRTFVLKLCFY